MEKLETILKEADKCLNCKNPLCQKGCPIKTKIPNFIDAIKKQELETAYNILCENNIMSDICSNVCPYEEYCMRSLCKRNKSRASKNFKARKICKYVGKTKQYKICTKKRKNK